jgi:hypothetical protein
LGIARCLVTLGRPRDAMPHLQRVRRHAAELPAEDVEQARRWNTLLARLYLRTANDPLFTYGGSVLAATARLRDVVALGAGKSGAGEALGVLTESAFLLYEPDGRLAQSFAVQNPRGLFADASGALRVVTRTGVQTERPLIVSFRVPRGGGDAAVRGPAQPLEDMAAAALLPSGELLAADRRARTLQRFTADGDLVGPFAPAAVTRLAVSPRGDVAALDRDTRTILTFDPQGKPLARLVARSEGYQFQSPVDVAFDVAGHLYILDRDPATVWIFGPDGKLFGRVASPTGSEGAFDLPTAFTVDAIGRLFIYDDRLHRVVRYQ